MGIGQCRTISGDQIPNRHYSPAQLESIDRRVREILEAARQRAASILRENRPLLETLRDLLLERKVIDAKTLATIAGVGCGRQERIS